MEIVFECDICQKRFKAKKNMLSHRRTHFEKSQYSCDQCNRSFTRKSDLKQHVKFFCRNKVKAPPLDTDSTETNDGFKEVITALKNRIKTYTIDPPSGDVVTVMNKCKDRMVTKILEVLTVLTALKFNIFLECQFTNEEGDTCTRSFKTRNVSVLRTSNVTDLLSDAIDKIKVEKSECEMKGSGWNFEKITRLELRINKYNPLKGSQFIQLPAKIANTKSVINIQNDNEFCFKYAIMSKFIMLGKAYRLSSYINNDELENKYNWSCLTYPVKLNDIRNFETANGVSINVFGINEKDEVYPLKITDEELEDHFDLLFITEGLRSHYCYISDLGKLIHSQLTSDGRKLLLCKRCLTHFYELNGLTAEERLEKHKEICSTHNKPVRCELPSYNIRFKNAHRSKKVRFTFYADFETMLVLIDSCQGNPEKSWTSAYQLHEPYSYAYLLKDSEDEYTTLRQFRGENAAKHLMESVIQDMQTVDRVLYANKKLDVPSLTPEQWKVFRATEICHICKEGNFTDVNYRVRNHCHVSGKYLGVAHRNCNLLYQDQHFVPFFVHNLSSFDGHFLTRELGFDTETISVIPNTEEKYISFSKSIKVKFAKNQKIELRFLDSYRFMPFSLATLTSYLPEKDFLETKKYFPDHFDLVKQKGVFPYEYVTEMAKLDDTKLPPQAVFYSQLTDEDIKDDAYEHAKTVWRNFNCMTLGDYSDIYVKTDVLLLCDIFESFRRLCLETYNLDPAYYYTVPGLAFDAMLKCTGVELELIRDMDMLMMIEKGIRGGITQCIKRHVVANNKHLEDTYNQDSPSNYLLYVDANNLYGWAMVRNLPYRGFHWLQGADTLNVASIPYDSEDGYILEVDLEYPEHLHDSHADFAFCTETKVPPGGKTRKLLATVEDKNNYIIHYVALKQAIEHGVVLKKIHRAITFKQSPWMKTYVDLNTKMRTQALNDFEVEFFKGMTNSVFGKTMEDVRHRLDIRLVSDPKKAEKLIAKPNFISSTIYTEDLVALQMEKTKIVFNKPIYAGMSILDISKTLMYQFFYDTLQPYYGERVRIVYQDTDSFILEIQTSDLYEDLEKHFASHLDTSNYPTKHPLFSKNNKKVLGKFKDELGGDILEAFVGLRSKVYAIKRKGGVMKKLKGISKSVIKKKIKFDDYVRTLYEGGQTRTVNNRITSNQHIVKTVSLNKVTLSGEDDKRVILENKVQTLPYGHWRLEGPPAKRVKLE